MKVIYRAELIEYMVKCYEEMEVEELAGIARELFASAQYPEGDHISNVQCIGGEAFEIHQHKEISAIFKLITERDASDEHNIQ